MSDTLQIERVDATAWRDACSSAARDGWRFSSLHAAAGEELQRARLLHLAQKKHRVRRGRGLQRA